MENSLKLKKITGISHTLGRSCTRDVQGTIVSHKKKKPDENAQKEEQDCAMYSTRWKKKGQGREKEEPRGEKKGTERYWKREGNKNNGSS